MAGDEITKVAYQGNERKAKWHYLIVLGALALTGLLGYFVTHINHNPGNEPTPQFSFLATVIEVHDDSVLVEPFEGQDVWRSSDRIAFATGHLPELPNLIPGNPIKVWYDGNIMESYPAQVHATDWALITE